MSGGGVGGRLPSCRSPEAGVGGPPQGQLNPRGPQECGGLGWAGSSELRLPHLGADLPAALAPVPAAQPPLTASPQTEELFDLIASSQSRRLDDQRASLGRLPGLRVTHNNLGHLRGDRDPPAPGDEFFNMLIKCQVGAVGGVGGARPQAPRGSALLLGRVWGSPGGDDRAAQQVSHPPEATPDVLRSAVHTELGGPQVPKAVASGPLQASPLDGEKPRARWHPEWGGRAGLTARGQASAGSRARRAPGGREGGGGARGAGQSGQFADVTLVPQTGKHRPRGAPRAPRPHARRLLALLLQTLQRSPRACSAPAAPAPARPVQGLLTAHCQGALGAPGSSTSHLAHPTPAAVPRGGLAPPGLAWPQPLPWGCPRASAGPALRGLEGEAPDRVSVLPSPPESTTSAARRPTGCPAGPPCPTRTSSASSRGCRPSAWTSSGWTSPGARSRRWAGPPSLGNSASLAPAKASNPQPGPPSSWMPRERLCRPGGPQPLRS